MTQKKPLFATLASLTSIDGLIEYFNLLTTYFNNNIKGESNNYVDKKKGVGDQ